MSVNSENQEADEDVRLSPEKVREVLYGAMVGAWINTRMEFDKTLLGLSTLLLGTWPFWKSELIGAPPWVKWLYGLATGGLLVTIVAVVVVLKLNSRVIEDEIRERNGGRAEQCVKWLDVVAAFSFVVGMVLWVALGVVVMWHPDANQWKGGDVASKKETMVGGLPKGKEGASVGGIGQLKPPVNSGGGKGKGGNSGSGETQKSGGGSSKGGSGE